MEGLHCCSCSALTTTECKQCGMPICSEDCLNHVLHTAVCADIHDEELVGVTFGRSDAGNISNYGEYYENIPPNLEPGDTGHDGLIKIFRATPKLLLFGMNTGKLKMTGKIVGRAVPVAVTYIPKGENQITHKEHPGGQAVVLITKNPKSGDFKKKYESALKYLCSHVDNIIKQAHATKPFTS